MPAATVNAILDADGYGNRCDTDIHVPNDGVTNLLDVGVLQAQFGTPGPDADFTGDVLNVGVAGDYRTNPSGYNPDRRPHTPALRPGCR